MEFSTQHFQIWPPKSNAATTPFFVVPTATFRGLFVCIMLAHERRRIVHCNITQHPTAQWTAQQVIEAFPWAGHASIYCVTAIASLGQPFGNASGTGVDKEVVIAPRRPWQHPYVERLIGSIRRECLDHVAILHMHHLTRILASSLACDHQWRTHLLLAMNCPVPRPILAPDRGKVVAVPEVGGLPHHDERRAASLCMP